MSTATVEEARAAAARVLGAPVDRMEPLSGGANNLVFQATSGGRSVLVKAYFSHPRDARDRLGVEFGMLDFLWKHGVYTVPQPLRAEPEQHIGVYEFVVGARLRPGEVGWGEASEMVDLLARMWALRNEPEAQALPAGSDAGFSLRNFLDNVGGRFRRCHEALAGDATQPEVARFVREDVRDTWARIERFVDEGARRFGLDVERPLPRSQQTLNPADHGFHNVLREAGGRLRFLDFEYAGWDDPVQMICNACLQPAVPLPVELRGRFVDELLLRIEGDRALKARIRLLFPLFGIKWSLIMLNEFLPVEGDRRRFAGTRPEEHKREQLAKSRRRLYEVRAYLAKPCFEIA